MQIETNVDITSLSGLHVVARAHSLAHLKKLEDVALIMNYAKINQLNLVVIGNGTNTVWGSSYINELIVKNEIMGFELTKENDKEAYLRVGAGESWDQTVARSVELDLSGLEALSGIPGTVGAAPIQNIGAYGDEVSNSIEAVNVYDLESEKVARLTNRECQFGYRDSYFKQNPGRFITTSVEFRLSKSPPSLPKYKDILNYFFNQPTPNSKRIREAVLNIRSSKMPDPKMIPNCGSFFKNPIISSAQWKKIRNQYPEAPSFENPAGVKIPAGWLVEMSGLKGVRVGQLETYKNHALILIASKGQTTPQEVCEAVEVIKSKVFEKFGIELEQEPITIK